MTKKQHTDLPVLEYKGFKGLLEYNARDNGRIYGKICPPESPDIPLDSWGYAGDSVDDIRKTFESQVESIIWSREYNDAFRQWLKVTRLSGKAPVFRRGMKAQKSVPLCC